MSKSFLRRYFGNDFWWSCFAILVEVFHGQRCAVVLFQWFEMKVFYDFRRFFIDRDFFVVCFASG